MKQTKALSCLLSIVGASSDAAFRPATTTCTRRCQKISFPSFHPRFAFENNRHSLEDYASSRLYSTRSRLKDEKERISKYSSFPLTTPQIKGIIFDMDGTLVNPCIDFADMRRRVYNLASNDSEFATTMESAGPVTEGCVLEIVERLSPKGQAECQKVFQDIEQKALRDMSFMDGLIELCLFLDDQKIPRAVLTRNVQTSIVGMHEKLKSQFNVAPFDPAVARDTIAEPGSSDNGNNDNDLNTVVNSTATTTTTTIPSKPEPDGIYFICQQWKCDPSEVVMVGDSDQDDIVAAYRAGCGASVLLMDSNQQPHDNNSGNDNDSEIHERKPSVQLDSLRQLQELLLAASPSKQ